MDVFDYPNLYLYDEGKTNNVERSIFDIYSVLSEKGERSYNGRI